MASPKAETKQSLTLLLIMLSVESIYSQIVESAISKILSLRSACSTYLCKSTVSPNMSSVGLLPVNISSKNIPRLYTSPIVETAEP